MIMWCSASITICPEIRQVVEMMERVLHVVYGLDDLMSVHLESCARANESWVLVTEIEVVDKYAVGKSSFIWTFSI